MANVSLTINDKKVTVPAGTTILHAAEGIGAKIPTLCYHPEQEIKANCRVCVVEVEGRKNLLPSCSTMVEEGMNIKTTSPRVIQARKTILELILASHPQDCLHCARSGQCELQDLAKEYNIRNSSFPQDGYDLPLDMSTPAIVRDPNKCILCGRCIEVCSSIQTVNALGYAYRGHNTQVVPTMGWDLLESPCVMCGQCIHACPVGAIYEHENIDDFISALADPNKIVVTQIAPAVRLAVAEEIGKETGDLPMEKLVTALRNIGFDYVLHTNFSADLTIMEEGNELLERINEGGTLPMFTSCCPSWVRFTEIFYPDLLDNLSSCKSPQQMFGSLVKTYWAEKMGVDPAKIYSVSIMPCTAKKYEAQRPEMQDSGYQDVDLVLTSREIGRLFRMHGINPSILEGSDFDSWMGKYTGAGVLFGVTGGVMEAALRTVYEITTGQSLQPLEFSSVRGMEGIKEAEVDLLGKKIRVAAVHGLGNARSIIEEIQKGESPYHFIEVMACPGGCIGGGGQPITKNSEKRAERMEALYWEEMKMPLRKSHENPEIKELYEQFLHQPLGQQSHNLLHTQYSPRTSKLSLLWYDGLRKMAGRPDEQNKGESMLVPDPQR